MSDLFREPASFVKLSAVTIMAAFTLSAESCGGGGSTTPSAPAPTVPTKPGANPTPTPPPAPTVSPLMVASNWEIGPVIDGQNYSKNMPLQPTQTPEGWTFNFPLEGGTVNYLTTKYGSLVGKRHIVIRYRVETDPLVDIWATSYGLGGISLGPTLYFQDKNDDWNTDTKRWWATKYSPENIKAGEYTLDVPFDGGWVSMMGGYNGNSPEFAKALSNVSRVGFTFGGGTGYGHGVFATGPARFTLLSFVIE